MNELEAIGDLAQGGLTARAVEPTAGEGAAPGPKTGADGHTHESACLNCGTPLVGAHCHACGQRGHQHKTLGAFFHDLLHGVLHFEGKIWRTVPMLAWQPGRLTREYIDGRRASYVSPIALFLFTIFLMFAVISALGADDALLETVDVDARAAIEQADRATADKLAASRERLADEKDADDRARLEAQIARLERERSYIGSALGVGEGESRDDATGAEDTGLEINGAEVSARGGLRSAWQKAKENPQLLAYKLQTSAYKFAWLLIPISVPFVALTFAWRRRFGLYDHTIFTTYSITFMIALLFAASLVSYFVSGVVGFLMLLYAPVHLYKQLRGTYELRRFSAVWRMLALSLFAWWAIIIFAVALVMMAE
jgi:hypothetical protein